MRMGRGRALFVCPHIPQANAVQAGHKTAYDFLVELAREYEVDAILLCRTKEYVETKAETEQLRGIINRCDVIPFSDVEVVLGLVHAAFCGIAPRFGSRLTPKARRFVGDALRTLDYDVLWCEFSQSFWAGKLVGDSTRVVFSAHDIQTQVIQRKAAWECMLFLGWTYRCEKRLMASADRIRVQSKKDAALVSGFLQEEGAKIEVVGPKIGDFVYRVRRIKREIERHSLLFWGAMNRRENSIAAIAFVKGGFRQVRQTLPDAKLYVVGANPPPELLSLRSESIFVTGFVEDPSRFFEKCTLGIAPLSAGAGIKVKVLEMLEAGMPVVSTPVGAEGIEPNERLTVSDLEHFPQAICKLLE